MTSNIHNTKQQLWVAIDVAKSKHDVLIEYPNHTQRHFVIKNTQEGFHRLTQELQAGSWAVDIALEATGYYHRAIAYFLSQQGFNMHLVSSVATARTRETLYHSRDKNDTKDTKVILYLLKSGLTQYFHDLEF